MVLREIRTHVLKNQSVDQSTAQPVKLSIEGRDQHMRSLTIRSALPVIAILTIVAIAIIAFALLSHAALGGTAWNFPQ